MSPLVPSQLASMGTSGLPLRVSLRHHQFTPMMRRSQPTQSYDCSGLSSDFVCGLRRSRWMPAPFPVWAAVPLPTNRRFGLSPNSPGSLRQLRRRLPNGLVLTEIIRLHV